MGSIWLLLTVISMAYALLTGGAERTAQALLLSGGDAVKLTITLLGTMSLWSGFMEVMRESGDVERVGRGLKKLLSPLFPPLDDEIWAPISLNLSANLLGLGNAATPAGIQAAQLLEKRGEEGLRALAMLLALNNSSLQLIPTTVITLRAAHGASAPADIWLPMLVSSLVATLTAAAGMALFQRVQRRKEAKER